MSTKAQPIDVDVTDSGELLDLAEEVRRSGVGRLLKRGEHALALVTPVAPPQPVQARRQPRSEKRDAVLNIIGLGASAEPTDIARHKPEYLAEAYAPSRQ